MNKSQQDKWDSAAGFYDLLEGFGPERRWRPYKQKLYSKMNGKILFLAVGTGLDILSFPPNQDITGIDISPKMLEKAQPRVEAYAGNMTTQQMDVHELKFADNTFDQVFTACTFCSVPDPIKGLVELRRVLKPEGTLNMFEHTGSFVFPFNVMLNFMNPAVKSIGPEINRNTVANVKAAGFKIEKINHVFLDIVKTIEAKAP